MQRAERLRRRSDFSAVYGRGRSWSSDLLAVRVLRTQGPHSRFGFAVGKRVGGAVVRNQVKRRLREAVRALGPLPGWDVVVIARAPAAQADYWSLLAALRSLLGRAGLLAPVAAEEGRGG
jgi:ribonuclease P protein component